MKLSKKNNLKIVQVSHFLFSVGTKLLRIPSRPNYHYTLKKYIPKLMGKITLMHLSKALVVSN